MLRDHPEITDRAHKDGFRLWAVDRRELALAEAAEFKLLGSVRSREEKETAGWTQVEKEHAEKIDKGSAPQYPRCLPRHGCCSCYF